MIALAPQTGEIAADIGFDGGVLTRELERAVGSAGTVIAWKGDVVDSPSVALCDVVGSLCTVGFLGLERLAWMKSLIRAGGRIGCVVWDREASLHERILLESCEDSGLGVVTEHNLLMPSPVTARGQGFALSMLHDVVRFEGVAHYWQALVTERSYMDAAVRRVSKELKKRAYDECVVRLQPYTARDGTVCIPVQAALWFYEQ